MDKNALSEDVNGNGIRALEYEVFHVVLENFIFSDDKDPIKYILIGDCSNMKIITEFSLVNPNQKKRQEINRIFNKLAK